MIADKQENKNQFFRSLFWCAAFLMQGLFVPVQASQDRLGGWWRWLCCCDFGAPEEQPLLRERQSLLMQSWQLATQLFNAVDVGDQNEVARLLPMVPEVDGRPLALQAWCTGEQGQGISLLHLAAWRGHTEIVQMLVDHGANVLLRDRSSCGSSPLHGVRKREIAQILLDAGADINARDNSGQTPLCAALSWGFRDFQRYRIESYLDVAQFLVEKGADVNIPNKKGIAPLRMAISWRQESLARLLIEKGACLDACDLQGWTSLHQAAFQCLQGIISYMIEKGASVNVRDSQGNTPLMVCMGSQSWNLRTARTLIAYGADINLQGREGRTPLHVAFIHRAVELAELLMAEGADVNIRDNLGKTPLFYAAECT
ncbi:hypothetical protein EBZ39_08920 [bacterium]|nr:hypothetical protein [bacterium]